MAAEDRETRDMLRALANKLATSAHQLAEAARRLHLAELTYREYLVRLRKLDEQMQQLTDLLRGTGQAKPAAETNPAFCQPPAPKPQRRKLRYSDYIELSNYAELKKFEKMGQITDREVNACDADDLMKRLLKDGPAA